jgi:hypothetical protein
MRDEVIKVDSTHHAIGKIGQHVCSGMEVGWHPALADTAGGGAGRVDRSIIKALIGRTR